MLGVPEDYGFVLVAASTFAKQCKPRSRFSKRELKNIAKHYASWFRSLNDVTIEVPQISQGALFGVLGDGAVVLNSFYESRMVVVIVKSRGIFSIISDYRIQAQCLITKNVTELTPTGSIRIALGRAKEALLGPQRFR